MDRPQITAVVVEQADRLLGEGIGHATIVARLGISRYVLEVIACDPQRDDRPQPRQMFARRSRNPSRGVDVGTIHMIQRMLAAGLLNHREIARDAGVSPHVVERVANGRRTATSTERPFVFDGEHYVPESVRCGECGARISIVPCRACRARRESSQESC